MRRIRIKSCVLFALMLFIFSSCLEQETIEPTEYELIDSNCISNHEIGYVHSINGASTGNIEEKINIEVTFKIHNGCGSFGKFIEIQSGNTTIIEVDAKYKRCVLCAELLSNIAINYEFEALASGIYYLKFKSSPTEYIVHTLTIN